MADNDPHVTTWAKIVPRRDTADPAVGLAARVADPLWLMARQYQFGEFNGDDGAAPVQVKVQATWTPITRWLPGDTPSAPAAGLPYDRLHQPLESLVEDDRALSGALLPPLLDTVEAGSRLIRRLKRANLDSVADHLLEQHHVLPINNPNTDGSDLFGQRTVDGFSVRATIENDPTDVLPSGLSADQKSKAAEIVAEWKSWFDQRFGYTHREGAWIPNRLEHRFTLAAPHPDGGELVLSAPEYLGQGIQWYDLDLVPQDAGITLGAEADAGDIKKVSVSASFPQPIRWPGMPVDRFWEMEDAAVDFGVVKLSPTDIAGLLAVDLAVTAGTDWFLLGVPLPVGGVARIDSIVVRDVFGDNTLIRIDPSQQAGLGRLFEPAAKGSDGASWLVFPPSLLRRVDGPPLEEVFLIRDEMANLGWAVEQIAPLDDGDPVDVNSRIPPRPPTIRSSATPAESLQYVLTSGVPENWKPLVPMRDAATQARIFVLGQIWGAEKPAAFTLLSRQLGPILDEEVPREGKRLQRFWQYGRWSDGSRHLWCGREVHAGRGEGNSALRYDLAI